MLIVEEDLETCGENPAKCLHLFHGPSPRLRRLYPIKCPKLTPKEGFKRSQKHDQSLAGFLVKEACVLKTMCYYFTYFGWLVLGSVTSILHVFLVKVFLFLFLVRFYNFS